MRIMMDTATCVKLFSILYKYVEYQKLKSIIQIKNTRFLWVIGTKYLRLIVFYLSIKRIAELILDCTIIRTGKAVLKLIYLMCIINI